jgi:hypothetical protein
MRNRLFELLLLAAMLSCWLIAWGCVPNPSPADPVSPNAASSAAPVPRHDDTPTPNPYKPGPTDASRSSCAAACEALSRLGCPGATGSRGRDDVAGTADDVPCARACEEIEAAGIRQATGCIAAASSCAAVDACSSE